MKTRLAFACVCFATPAWAHAGHAHPVSWLDTLTLDPAITVPLILSGALYAIGTARLWRRAGIGHGVARWQTAAFAGGWLTLVAALVSPVHWMGEQLFSMHMIEHELLMAVAAPLLALSRPTGAFLWALPPAWRRGLRRATHARGWLALWHWLTRPVIATIMHGVAIWVWHIPALFDAALTNEWMHLAQHISFLGTALLFWWALLRQPVRHYGVSALHVYVTMVHTSLLGVILLFARHAFYTSDPAHLAAWGYTALEDQQMGGLVMWVPAGTIYAAAGIAFAIKWIGARSSGTATAWPSRLSV